MESNEDLEDLKGVGSATAEKLIDAGYNNVKSLAVAGPQEVSDAAGIGENTASKIIRNARKKADIGGFETGTDVLERRKEIGKIKLLVPEVDGLLGGGIETQSITEAYGEFGSGKSQLTHQLSINVQLPEELGGLGQSAIFIDTEDTFRPERIRQMVLGLDDEVKEQVMEEWGIDGELGDEDAQDELVEAFLSNIHRATAYNSDHQILLMEKAKELASEMEGSDFPLGIIIIDSLTAHFRAEYVGRGNLANRQQKLNKHLHDILRIANLNNAAAVVTNQVQSNPDAMFGDPTKPIGGNVLGHTSTFRVYIRKSKKDKRVVKLVDAPNLPDGEAVLRIKEEGIKPE